MLGFLLMALIRQAQLSKCCFVKLSSFSELSVKMFLKSKIQKDDITHFHSVHNRLWDNRLRLRVNIKINFCNKSHIGVFHEPQSSAPCFQSTQH